MFFPLMISLPHSLTKEVEHRPKFQQLLEDPFIKKTEAEQTDIGVWFRTILDKEKTL